MTADRPRAYLDHNATSPLRPEARAAMRAVWDGPASNPASMHAEGRAARAVLERAREQVALLAGCRESEVVLTSGGSEGIAAAVRGVCDRAPDELRRVVVSAVEHSAVLEAAQQAARQGRVVVRVPCGPDGRVDVERFEVQLGDDVTLAVLQWANNETGVVQPVAEVGRLCRERKIPFLVDAVQAAGKLPVEIHRVLADLLVVSGHKLGGPQGTGALIVREGIALAPLIGGGAQEKRRRGGTPAVAAQAGFGAAAEIAATGVAEESRRLLQLRARVETRLRAAFPGVRVHGEGAPRLPNTVNFAIPGVPGETLVIALDLAGFALSTGSACASGAVEPSHVVRAMGFGDEEARGAVRLSMGWSTTEQEIERLLDELPELVARVREGLDEPA